jgi:hypothetical protein
VAFQAKAVISHRYMTWLYPARPRPGSATTPAHQPDRDGRMMAYRAGAELMDLDFFRLHNGPRYLARCGQATWVGVYRDPQGKPIGPFVTKPEILYGDATPEADKLIFKKYHAAGRGPCYMDGTGISEKDYQEMYDWLQHEGNHRSCSIWRRTHRLPQAPHRGQELQPGRQGKIVTDQEGMAASRAFSPSATRSAAACPTPRSTAGCARARGRAGQAPGRGGGERRRDDQ